MFSEYQALSVNEAKKLVNYKDRQRWNVVSIWDHHDNACPNFPGAKKLHQVSFHDISMETKGYDLCKVEHINGILSFAKKVSGEPILVHCHAGISRSTAILFLILLDDLKNKSEIPAEDAFSMVYRVRRIMYPNRHIIHIGLPLVARSDHEAIRWFRELYNSDTMRKVYN